MLLPLLFHDHYSAVLSVREDDVDRHSFALHEPVDSMHSLNKVVELVSRPDENSPVAMSLEIASTAKHLRLRRKVLNLPVGKVHHDLFAIVVILRAEDRHASGNLLLNFMPLRFQIVPD